MGNHPGVLKRTVTRLATSAKIRTTVEFLRHYFQQRFPPRNGEEK